MRRVKNLAKVARFNGSDLCAQACPYRLAKPGTSQPKAKRLIAFSCRYAPKNIIRLPSLLITTALKNDGGGELRFAIIFFPSLFFNLC